MRRFHVSCEDLLKKYGKGIIQKQYLLARCGCRHFPVCRNRCTARMHSICASGLEGRHWRGHCGQARGHPAPVAACRSLSGRLMAQAMTGSTNCG